MIMIAGHDNKVNRFAWLGAAEIKKFLPCLCCAVKIIFGPVCNVSSNDHYCWLVVYNGFLESFKMPV